MYGLMNVFFGTMFNIGLYVVFIRDFCKRQVYKNLRSLFQNEDNIIIDHSLEVLYTLAVVFILFALSADIYQMVNVSYSVAIAATMSSVKILFHYLCVVLLFALIELKLKSRDESKLFLIKSLILYSFFQYAISAIVPALFLLLVYPFKVISIIACILTLIYFNMLFDSFLKLLVERFNRFVLICLILLVYSGLYMFQFFILVILYILVFVNTSTASSWEYSVLPIVAPIIIRECNKTVQNTLRGPNKTERPGQQGELDRTI